MLSGWVELHCHGPAWTSFSRLAGFWVEYLVVTSSSVFRLSSIVELIWTPWESGQSLDLWCMILPCLLVSVPSQ